MEKVLYKTNCFNPLDRGHLYQIKMENLKISFFLSFNPLDRGNLYLMLCYKHFNDPDMSFSFNPLDRGNLYLIRQRR